MGKLKSLLAVVFGAGFASALLVIPVRGEEAWIPKTTESFIVQSKKKPDHEWKPQETYTLKQLKGYTSQTDPEYSRFGGIKSTQFPATGFIYTTKHHGRWWLVDPEGHLFIHKGICALEPGTSERNEAIFKEKYGTKQGWAEATAALLKELGFNGSACWSNDDLLQATTNRPVYTIKLGFMSSFAKKKAVARMGDGNHKYNRDVMPVFDPEFEQHADNYAKQVAKYKDDPYLLGYFSDNELPLRPHILELVLKLDENDHAYQAAMAWLKKHKITPDELTGKHKDAFYAYYLERYYSTVRAALKKYDPNHLYLGSRIIGVSNNETAVRTYAKYADVMSINWYGAWLLPRERMENWAKWCDKPFIISEWYAKGHDVPGLKNISGAGWLVKTQKERGYYYQNMALNLMATRQNVGWHWFKYMDNDPANLRTDPSNRNSNKGIVNTKYELYTDLTDAMKEINTQAYRVIEFFDDASYEDASLTKP